MNTLTLQSAGTLIEESTTQLILHSDPKAPNLLTIGEAPEYMLCQCQPPHSGLTYKMTVLAGGDATTQAAKTDVYFCEAHFKRLN